MRGYTTLAFAVAALGVAAALDEATIRAALREGSGRWFLPRRVGRVAALPRNDTGERPRDALRRLRG